MPRTPIDGLIQTAALMTDPSAPIDTIRQAAIDAHSPLIDRHCPEAAPLLEQPAHAVANRYFMACSNRVGTDAPWNIARFQDSSYFVDPRGGFFAIGIGDKDELVAGEMDPDTIEAGQLP